jgi:GNAT superfamily N-acetyltransferase
MGIQVWASELAGQADLPVTVILSDLRSRVAGRLEVGMRSSWSRYGLQRDLTVPFAVPSAKIPIEVRPLEAADLDILLPLQSPGRSAEDTAHAMWRRRFLTRIPIGCHVAVDGRTGLPCYMQWLIGPAHNDLVAKLDGFPPLAPDEALLENAYTPPSHRGLGVMSTAMAMIAERATGLGARYVTTFVTMDNLASLKGCERSGFRPHLIHHGRQYGYRLFTRHRYEVLPEGDARRSQSFFAS